LARFITPDWAAKATAVPYAEFADPQSLNLYTYVRNVPTVRFDPDGHDFANVWRKIKEAASEVSGKATIGLGVGGKIKVGPGVGGKIKVGPGEAKLEAAVKVNTSISAKGKVSVSQSVEIGASIGSKGRKVGLGIEAEQVKGSVDLKTGEVKGPEPATGEILVGRSNGNSTSSKGSEGGQSLGLEEGELALAGLEVSITKEGVDAFKDALHDLKDTLFPAPPPAPPAPAGPAGP